MNKKKNERCIYESPDGGESVFRRPFLDYDSSKKEEIDWKTKEPTERLFTDYQFNNKDKNPKKENPWSWADNQLKTLMNVNKILKEENKRLKEYVKTLESQADELNHTLAGRK
tara:strand:- start:1211 stop:1549 length:339 start_codon:yes stop_codon:yes gene_type:complete